MKCNSNYELPTIVLLSTKEQFIRTLQSANRILSRVMFCYVFCMSNAISTYLVLIKSVGKPTTCLFRVDQGGNLQNNKHKNSSLQTNPISLSIGSNLIPTEVRIKSLSCTIISNLYLIMHSHSLIKKALYPVYARYFVSNVVMKRKMLPCRSSRVLFV